MKRRAAQLLVLALLLGAGRPTAQTQGQRPGYSERVDVNLRTILAIATDSKGRFPEKPLTPEDVEILEDGVPAKIVAVEPVEEPRAPNPSKPAEPAEPAAAGLRPARIFCFDFSLLRRGSVKRAADAISKNLGALLSGGPLEILLADPDPTVFLAATTEASRARDALTTLSGQVGRDRVQDVRTTFLAEESLIIGPKGRVPGSARAAQARSSIQQEIALIRNSLRRLGDWAVARVARQPAVLFLVIDGFDEDVTEFYGKWLNDDNEVRRLHQEFGYEVKKEVGQVAVLLSNQGLLTIPVSTGGLEVTFSTDAATMGSRPTNDPGNQTRGTSPLLFLRPLEPLSQIAEMTGGDVVTRADRFSDALDRLSHAVAITYRMDRPADGKQHTLSVRSRREGVTLLAPHFVIAGTSDRLAQARAVEALRKPAEGGGLAFAASVDSLEVKANKNSSGLLHVSIDLAGITEAVEAGGPGRVRVTVAFEGPVPALRPRGQPTDLPSQNGERHLPVAPTAVQKSSSASIFNEELDLIRTGTGSVWRHDAALQWSPHTTRLSVVVEELKTGLWGSRVVELPTPERTGTRAVAEALPTAAAIGVELSATFDLVDRKEAGKAGSISARLHVTIDVEPILSEIARAGAWRPVVTVEAEGPNYRTVVAKSQLTIPFDIAVDNWNFFVPVTWPANASRLLVTLREPTAGGHAGAVIELARDR